MCAFPITHQQQLDSKQGFRDWEEGNKEGVWKGHAEQVEEPEQKSQELVFWVNGFETGYSKQRSFKDLTVKKLTGYFFSNYHYAQDES